MQHELVGPEWNKYRLTARLVGKPFSPREKEILWLVLQGKTTKEIAKTLCICQNTANRHVYRMCVRSGVHSRLQLAIKVLRGLNEQVIQ